VISIQLHYVYTLYLGKLQRPHCDLTGLIVSIGNHPQITLLQVGELLQFTHLIIYIYYIFYIHHNEYGIYVIDFLTYIYITIESFHIFIYISYIHRIWDFQAMCFQAIPSAGLAERRWTFVLLLDGDPGILLSWAT
jgi:hypothetical protein